MWIILIVIATFLFLQYNKKSIPPINPSTIATPRRNPIPLNPIPDQEQTSVGAENANSNNVGATLPTTQNPVIGTPDSNTVVRRRNTNSYPSSVPPNQNTGYHNDPGVNLVTPNPLPNPTLEVLVPQIADNLIRASLTPSDGGGSSPGRHPVV